MNFRSEKKLVGFTIMELVVAIAVMLILGAVVTPMLLSYLNKSRLAALQEDVLNMSLAIRSACLQENGEIIDSGDDDDYLDDLYDRGYLTSDSINSVDDATWAIRRIVVNEGTDSEKINYYAEVSCADTDCWDLFNALDDRIEQDGASAGTIQWN
jgi:type II secretory pathway pseudopilin PulG